jgi:hypothetical protein
LGSDVFALSVAGDVELLAFPGTADGDVFVLTAPLLLGKTFALLFTVELPVPPHDRVKVVTRLKNEIPILLKL